MATKVQHGWVSGHESPTHDSTVCGALVPIVERRFEVTETSERITCKKCTAKLATRLNLDGRDLIQSINDVKIKAAVEADRRIGWARESLDRDFEKALYTLKSALEMVEDARERLTKVNGQGEWSRTALDCAAEVLKVPGFIGFNLPTESLMRNAAKLDQIIQAVAEKVVGA